MITGIHIENFKSLAAFDMQGMGPFVCVIGVNGSGKSTLLQAIDFISSLAHGSAQFRNWKRMDMVTSGVSARTILFRIDFAFGGKRAQWEARYNVTRQRVVEEHFRAVADTQIEELLTIRDGKMIWGSSVAGVAAHYPKDLSRMTYEGSVVAMFDFEVAVVQQIKQTLRALGSLELLSPERLRKAGQSDGPMGIGGDGLPGFLSSLGADAIADLNRRMGEIYPEVVGYDIKRGRFGWKRLLVRELAFKTPVPSEHINDGYLRMLAMISQRYSAQDLVLFDEIENGINQEVVSKLIGNLLDYNGKQVMITTHSPLVLNYLPDEVARQSVYLLTKNEAGHTQARRFFEIEGMAEKLKLMGPGEVVCDTNLLEVR